MLCNPDFQLLSIQQFHNQAACLVFGWAGDDEMNSDIAKALEVIDRQILNLQQSKRILLDAFSAEGSPIKSAATLPTTRSGNGNGNGNQNRKDQLITFLTQHGPSSRGKINHESGIPRGTIANLLNK